jgi:4-amino-4-deoxy-L-arabinose transferase-like glycosyltransferase
LVLCALIALARLHTFNEPFERDITTYAVIAHEMLQGRPLYSDMWDLKPPAVFVTYALGEVLGGYGPTAIYLLGVGAALITLLALYRIGESFGGKRCGVLAGVLWAIVCNDLYLQANQPNTEVFINACLAWAFALFLPLRADRFHAKRILLLGAIFALASLYKQVTLAVWMLLAMAYLVHQRSQWRMAARQVLAQFALIVAAWAAVVAYFTATGRWQDFYDTLFVIGKTYAGNIGDNLLSGLQPAHLWPASLLFMLPLLALCLLGFLIVLRRREQRQPWLLLLAWLVATPVAVALPGQFNPHYYQLWLPPLVIGASWSFVAFQRCAFASRLHLAPVAGALLLLFLLGHELPQFRLSADEWSRRKYHGDFFIRERNLAHEIDALLEPDETFYEYGREAGFYFYTKRHPPCGVIAGPTYNLFSSREIAQLEQAQPEMLIVCTGYPIAGPVIDWLMPRYQIFPRNHERGKFVLLARRGGKLEKRLQSTSSH